MIKSFAEKNTENIWNQQWINKLPKEIQLIAFRMLIMLRLQITTDLE